MSWRRRARRLAVDRAADDMATVLREVAAARTELDIAAARLARVLDIHNPGGDDTSDRPT